MHIRKSLSFTAIFLALTMTLASCKSAEERAEEHYQNGVALIETGDFDRALVELRNVFQLNGRHQDARHKLAELMRFEKENIREAYGQYLRLVEQYPDDLDARIALSEMAFAGASWDEVERHGAYAAEIAPDDPRVQSITIARAYRAAALEEDNAARRDEARKALALSETQRENVLLRNVLVDYYVSEGDLNKALAEIDWLIEQNPNYLLNWRQRLNVLVQMGDNGAIEQQLRDMVQQFPNDVTQKSALVRFLMSRKQPEKAEDFLRELIAAKPEDNVAAADLIRFLNQVKGPEAAKTELDRMIAERKDPVPFQVLGASFDFAAGEREKAVATLEGTLEGAEPSAQTRKIKVSLARMLLTMGNEVGARARVEEVLAENATHADALKMKAAWLIEADDTDTAIASLRTALDQVPEDAKAMTLMAQAYARAGRRELANDFLALAVEASGNAPEETIRYARILMNDERYLPAEDILLPALRLAPQNSGLLTTLGKLYLDMDDLGRVRQVVDTLRKIDTPLAKQAATGLEAERLNRQSGPADAMAFMEDIATAADASLASKIALVRARLSVGDTDGAAKMARQLVEEAPENEMLKTVLAASEAVSGNLEAAETLYRELLDANPDRVGVWLELARLKQRQGDPIAGQVLIDEALTHLPDDRNLLWAKASYLERDGDVEGAIAIYETLYAAESHSVVIANNLASLLSTYRDSADSLERAWVIARRFRDTDIPAMQDTYGWIAHRRGDSAEAVTYLESAARGLPNDPLVQYHLGQVYLALERPEDALRQFRATVENAGPADLRAQIEDARSQIQALLNAAEN